MTPVSQFDRGGAADPSTARDESLFFPLFHRAVVDP
jgi:hypothetical protein